MSPKYTPRTRSESKSSYEEFRSAPASGSTSFLSDGAIFWRYLLTRDVAPVPDSNVVIPIDSDEHRVLSRATGAAGGFSVPTDFDSMIVSARRARGVIGPLAREIVTDGGRSLSVPAATALGTAAWTAENAAFTANDPTFGQVTLSAHKASTKVIFSEELAQDAVGLDELLAGELGGRIAAVEEAAFAVGDGAAKPHGITHSTNGVATVVASAGSTTTFTLADFRAAFAALPDAYKPNASWIMSASAFLNAASRLDTAGAPAIPSLHAATPTLFSRPVYISSELPAAAANARSVVVGDIAAGYTVRRVRGLGLHRQQEIHSDQGQLGLRLYERVDGRVTLPDALRILSHSAT